VWCGTLAAQGAAIYRKFGCSGCHDANWSVQAPSLAGLYGKRVPVAGGTLEIADERYIRDSILKPRATIAAGYQAVMPSYEGKISEDELVKIVAYIKSIGDAGAPQ
jgi:cytochrome c oxidase subunit 2